jgi:hypothetical protein
MRITNKPLKFPGISQWVSFISPEVTSIGIWEAQKT